MNSTGQDEKLGGDPEPLSGTEIQKMLVNVYATPPAIIEQVRELSGRKKYAGGGHNREEIATAAE